MLPLAMILKGQGAAISGSDRSCDQGRTPEKFDYLHSIGIPVVPQDGRGLTSDFQALVVSSAIEDSIPEVKRAKELGVPILKRAELLAQLFNGAQKLKIGVGGTSGKSTTTGMLAWILSEMNLAPTVMNGANFLNFSTAQNPYSSALVGSKDVFVAECDESDGSIVLYNSDIAVLNNVALDHKPVAELIPVFMKFLNNAKQVVLNIGNNEIEGHILPHYKGQILTVGVDHPKARLQATNLRPSPTGISAEIKDVETGGGGILSLKIPGRHNVENALCALGACIAAGLDLGECLKAISGFSGVARRLQNIGNYNNINIIDDFAHNPDKIKASLATLKEFKGRLLVMFQMHGYGPLKLMKEELAQSFIQGLGLGDVFFMPDVLYQGGTTDTSYGSADFVRMLNTHHVKAAHIPKREDILPALLAEAKSGDRIVIMGARDDTLSEFAQRVLVGLKTKG